MTVEDDNIVTLYMVASDEEEARRIARALLDERLIACANILPGGGSLYRWDGRIVEDEECYVLLKTRALLAAKVKERIVSLHSYDVPCIGQWTWDDGYGPYMEWVRAETSLR